MEYLHCLCDNIIINHCFVHNTFFAYVITLRIVIGVLSFVISFIIKCNTFIFYNVFKHLGVAKQGKMTWEKKKA
jgi:hypothetical protein